MAVSMVGLPYSLAANFHADMSRIGRAFAIVPRTWQPRGYVDIDDDDYKSEKHWLGTVAEKASVSTQE